MPGGRPPKPTKLKELTGNPGKRPLNKLEPKPQPSAPSCPSWLHAEAKVEWKRIVPELEALGLLAQIDRAALAAYCQAWAEFCAATKTLAKSGRVVTIKKTGYVMPHPAVAQQRSAWSALKAFASEFGFSPASRSRVKVQEKEERDPFELYLSGGASQN